MQALKFYNVLNIPRRHDAVATDPVFSDTPAVDSGVQQALVFVGRDTLVANAYPMKSGKQFVNTLEDNIRRQGAMDKLLSDDTIYIKTQVFRLLRYYSPVPRNIARSDWVTQNITHNMTSSIIQPHGLLSL